MTTPTARFEHLLSSRARIGWGAPVATARPIASPRYEFGGGYPDPASFPYDDMVEATARMMKAEGAQALTYGDPQGYRGLRELVCHKYRVFEGLEVTPENIFVANGSGHALSLAFGAFVDPGDPIICEGLRRQGRRCKLIYTIVNFQNPAGPDLSLRRRTELVRLAEEFDTFILEDDAYGELRFEGEPKPPVYALDRGGRVIRAGTLSKILGAGVRLGWLCAPRAMLPAFQGFNFGGGVNPFMSRVATFYLREHMEAHVKLLIGVYRAKRDAMLRGLWEVLEGIDVEISRPQGGFFIWIRLPAATDPARLEALAVAAQAQYTPGPAFFPNGGGERFIRLAFSYEPPEKCYEGARLIARTILDARR